MFNSNCFTQIRKINAFRNCVRARKCAEESSGRVLVLIVLKLPRVKSTMVAVEKSDAEPSVTKIPVLL